MTELVPLRMTEENFSQIISKTSLPVLIEFWDANDPESVKYQELFNRIAYEMNQKAIVARVHVGECPKLVKQFRVKKLPAFAVYRFGKLRFQAVGKLQKHELLQMLTGKN